MFIVNIKKYRFGEYRVLEVLIVLFVRKEDIVDIKEIISFCDKIFY